MDPAGEDLSELARTDDERTQLEAFLSDNRREVLRVLEGLTEDQARRRLVPSLTTVLGLVKHCVFVEQVWFDVAISGKTRAELGLPDDIDATFTLSDADTIASLSDEYAAAVATSERIAQGVDLDDLALHNRRSPLSVRWIYLHMIEELARHVGHADILREQIFAADQT